jgi:NADH:ubiquinone oxidoreductase subunit K
MGPGLTIVLVYSFYLFAKQVKFAIEHSKNIGRTLMLASILFSYGCYAIVYFFYYVQKTPDASDAFLLYFISTSVGSVIMAIGLHLVRKRLRELQEVKNTRKELSVFFNT